MDCPSGSLEQSAGQPVSQVEFFLAGCHSRAGAAGRPNNNTRVRAGEQIDSDAPRRWLFLSREMAVSSEEDGASRWALDSFGKLDRPTSAVYFGPPLVTGFLSLVECPPEIPAYKLPMFN
jgi:hypothetical protein